MPTQFGYQPSMFGYLAAPKAKPVTAIKPLSLAAAGAPSQANPYGLAGAKQAPKTAAYTAPFTGSGPVPQSTAQMPSTQPSATAAAAAAAQQPKAPVVPAGGGYDINTDPTVQQANAYAGLNDEQARSAALKQRQDVLLGYGDANLSRNVLGDETMAQAAAANPHSTLQQYATQRDQNLRALTESHNQNNTFYGGARILDEQNAATDYQNALARAASSVNDQLGGIDSSLSSALLASQQSRSAALSEAANRAMQYALANQSTPDTSGLDFASLLAALSGGGGAADSSATGAPADVPAASTNVFGNALSPFAKKVAANRTGASANQRQGIFSIR